jgi:hypothetical protein
MGSMAILSALFGMMGGFNLGNHSGGSSGGKSLRGERKANRSKELVEAMINKAQGKRDNRRRGNCELTRTGWTPKPCNTQPTPKDGMMNRWKWQQNYKAG